MSLTAPTAWSWEPQGVVTEDVTAQSRVLRVGPQAAVTGLIDATIRRRWQVQLLVVASADCAQLAEFYRQRRGPLGSFPFTNPNDGVTYPVRFDETALGLERWTTTMFRATAIHLIETTSVGPVVAADMFGAGELGAGEGGAGGVY